MTSSPSSPSSPVITSEGSPVIVIDSETEGWWMLVQGSSCTVPVDDTKVSKVYPFMLSGIYLPAVS